MLLPWFSVFAYSSNLNFFKIEYEWKVTHVFGNSLTFRAPHTPYQKSSTSRMLFSIPSTYSKDIYLRPNAHANERLKQHTGSSGSVHRDTDTILDIGSLRYNSTFLSRSLSGSPHVRHTTATAHTVRYDERNNRHLCIAYVFPSPLTLFRLSGADAECC